MCVPEEYFAYQMSTRCLLCVQDNCCAYQMRTICVPYAYHMLTRCVLCVLCVLCVPVGSHVPRPAQGPRIGVPQPASVSFSWRRVSGRARIELFAQAFNVSLTYCTCLKRNGTSIPNLNQGQLSEDGLDWNDIHQRNLGIQSVLHRNTKIELDMVLSNIRLKHMLTLESRS